MHDFGAFDSAGGVAGVHHQLGFLNDAAIVVIGVVGDNDNAVILPQVLQLRALHLQVVFPPLADEREIGIVVADLGPISLQELDNGE